MLSEDKTKYIVPLVVCCNIVKELHSEGLRWLFTQPFNCFGFTVGLLVDFLRKKRTTFSQFVYSQEIAVLNKGKPSA